MALIDKFLPRTEFESYEDFYSNFKVDIPENFNFAWDVMDILAAEKGGERAMLWCDELGAEAEFTYADIKRLSDQAANVLAAGGIKKGDTVMIILKRRYEYWPILLALHKMGVIAIPATHLLTSKDLVYRCTAADIAGIICIDDPELMYRIDEAEARMERDSDSAGDSNLRYKAFVRSVHTPPQDKPAEKAAKLFAERAGTVPNYSNDDDSSPAGRLVPWLDFNGAWKEASADFKRPPHVNTNNDIMLLYFTSGTTGMPKMVRHDYAYPLGHVATARYWHNVVPGGLHITVADTGWAKAAWGKIYGQWIAGTGLFIYDYDRFVPSAMLEVIAKYKVNTFCAPPTIYRFFIKEDLTKYDFSALKHCTVAGEPLNPEIYEQFLAGTGLRLHECYGQTELTVTMCTYYPWIEPRPGSMGKPAPGYDIDLLREDGTPCAMGEEGQLVVRTDKIRPIGLFGGYYRDDELTLSVWHDDVYYTGDVAWRDEDGYYWFVGRSDDVIKSSGYRIGPFEVESALLEHPAVLECAITGVPDEDRGTVVKATVILAKGWVASEELKTELQNHVKKTTAPYKYPRIVEFVTELPKTISGKIRRVQIREEDQGK
ncbi:AMP-binding protein [Leadbettera azotonutricia]|uniref:Acyl-coenzyme A synthetase ACSM3 n=1 Tax=Leadbettera azotonutricia (strain ATCC BAA-888 / DSM 13862 / ZAS-9) TaxID=545695 RepID=F5Y9V5_LEAAZ|nr:AMP-binding protein [Leadbettera azotonutricia]AEF81397.1 acyl-coenzyme A synthetase ACSM3 [Leadbettera azotonutricia ZAS-9]